MKDLSWQAVRHDGTIDVVVGVLPPIPVRLILIRAQQEAVGLEYVQTNVVNEDGEPTGEVQNELRQVRDADPYDVQALSFAILGLCWVQPELGFPDFRTLRRDVFRYGDEVQTVIMDAGYQLDGLLEAAREVMTEIEASVARAMGLVLDAEQGFPEAQEQS